MKKENEVLKKELKIAREITRNTTLNTSMVSARDGKHNSGGEVEPDLELMKLSKENAKLKRFKLEVLVKAFLL